MGRENHREALLLKSRSCFVRGPLTRWDHDAPNRQTGHHPLRSFCDSMAIAQCPSFCMPSSGQFG
eukprot:2710151-Rhodomonas_salina.2